MDYEEKRLKYEQWCKRSARSILDEHPLWLGMDKDSFHTHFFMSEKLYENIHVAIYRYDPMGIGHVSEDEYDLEIYPICKFVENYLFRQGKRNADEIVCKEVFEAVLQVFVDFFGEVYRQDGFTVKACELASGDICEAMKEELL